MVTDMAQGGEQKEKKEFRSEDAKTAEAMIMSAKKIAIISHRNPDGDTSGSGMAMRIMLSDKVQKIENICVDPLPTSFLYMPGVQHFVRDFTPSDFDLIITVDAAARHQTGMKDLKPEMFTGQIPLINIDHHISNEMFGTLNIVDADACSTTAVLWKMFEVLGWKVPPDAATCLLNGLMTDTGSLQHSNSTPESFRIAAKMLAAGADLPSIRKNVFRTTPVETLKLWGEILNRIDIDDNGVVISTVRESDFVKTKSDPKDISGAIDYLNMVPEAKYSLLLTERGGKVKGSFRTQNDDVNVSEIAGTYGGGGHIKAAGFTVPGRLHVERRFKIIPETREKAQEATAVKI
jgi:phosphoesterase RecJ-like protein